MILNKFFLFCFAMITLFVSCSSDDDSNNNTENIDNSNLAELPESYLGVYQEELDTAPDPTNLRTATIIETDAKTYTISFSDDTASLIDVQFGDITGNNNSFLQSEAVRDRGDIITLGLDDEGTIRLGVLSASVGFSGFK